MARSQQQNAAEAALQDQTVLLPKAKLRVVFAAMCLMFIVSYIDQSALGVALPAIGRDLHAEASVSWASTSGMIANTTFQVLYGRLSDIFGRKHIYLSAAFLLFVSDLLCGFAQTAAQLYVFRGFAGVACGGLNALTMIIVSDVVTLRERGKYQGLLGSCIGLANTVAPFLSAVIVDHATWRVLFWLLAPLALACFAVSYPIIPAHYQPGHYRAKLKQVDVAGILLSSVAVIFLLIPISSGGTSFAWTGALAISFLSIGGVAALAFVYVEYRVSVLPMMPLRVFNNKLRAAVYAQIFFSGCVYYAQLNFLPAFYQNVRGYSRIVSAALTVPMVSSQAVVTVFAGLYISKSGKYAIVINSGYLMLAAGCAIQIGIFNTTTPAGVLVLPLVLQGLGIGCTFQPSLVALQANAAKADRAIVISVRGLIRALGGAVGLAVASSLMANVLLKNVPADIPAAVREQMHTSVYATPDLAGLDHRQRLSVAHAYMLANRAVFAFYVPLMAISFALCWYVRDTGLDFPEPVQPVQPAADPAPLDPSPPVELDVREKPPATLQ